MGEYTIYALKSKARDWVYVGMTVNLEKRFGEHQKGKVRSTKPYRPFELIFKLECGTRVEARAKEKYYKHGQGKEYLKQLSVFNN